MIGLVICTYNRPEYLNQCLSTLKEADLSACAIVIVDDASTNKQTIAMIKEFTVDGVPIVKHLKKRNGSVKDSLIFGWDKCLEMGCDKLMNLDSDAIVKPNFVEVLDGLLDKNKQHIVTGFNSRNKRLNGNPRHPVKKEHKTFVEKTSIGGINMMFYPKTYKEVVRTVLEDALKKRLNWDDYTCRKMIANGNHIVVSKPSVVQHIGFESSMGHRESPDVAYDFDETERLELKNVTLIGIDCLDVNRLRSAAEYSCRNIDFAEVTLLSSIDAPDVTKIPPLTSKQAYSKFVIMELYKYVKTEFMLVFQHDGFVLNPKAWKEEWLSYDYMGASWDWYNEDMNGNGGFSLRSQKLMKAVAKDARIKEVHPEDHHICRTYRSILEKDYNIKFAPIEECKKFSIEGYGIKPELNNYTNEFGFHGNFVNVSHLGIDFFRKNKTPKERRLEAAQNKRRLRRKRK